jgi:hypothetical protein
MLVDPFTTLRLHNRFFGKFLLITRKKGFPRMVLFTPDERFIDTLNSRITVVKTAG